MHHDLGARGIAKPTPPIVGRTHDVRGLPACVPVVRVLVACGGISSLLYVVAIDVIAALRHSRYHNYTSQMVSELFAVGAPTRNLLIWLNIPYNLLVFAFAGGVWASSGSRRSARLAAAALAGYGTVSTAGLVLFPMDIRGTIDSRRDRRHIAATFVMSIFIVAAMVFGAFVRGVRFRLYTFATIVTVVAFGVLSGFLARPLPAPTPGLGLAERVNIYATMLWMGVLGVVLVRRQGVGPQNKQQ